jgi:probable F420-dependent oxidoreductase
MQFGVHLPTFWSDYGSSNLHVAIAEAAKAGEALGYASLWANDVIIVRSGIGHDHFHVTEPLITLASLIHLVPRIKLGTHVIVLPQRDAFLLAKQVAALELLSEGRLILGVGIGWRRDEFELLNADYEHRGAMADETIDVMRALWRDPVASFHGRFYDFSDALFLPKPTRDAPPIWIGGNTAAAVRRTARLGDGWLPYAPSYDVFRSGVELLRQLTEGRQTPTIAATINLRISRPNEPAAIQTKSAWQVVNIAGSPDVITQYLDQFRQVGLEVALCAFESEGVDDLLRQMRIFAEEIAPHFVEAN